MINPEPATLEKRPSGMTPGSCYDALIIVDPRFMGGTAMAVEADVRGLQAAGLTIGIHFVSSRGFFQPHEVPNPKLVALLDLAGVSRVSADRVVEARIAFFHHPEPFQDGIDNPITVVSGSSIIVCHQAPFKGDGALAYDPMLVQRRIKAQFGVNPVWAPISGLSREHLRSFVPFLRMTQMDWTNSFGLDDWRPKRNKLCSTHLVVGRHGRPHADKWGDCAADIAASLPGSANTQIRTMGTERDFFTDMGVDVDGWDVIPFNGEAVPVFLDSLDVFSYFHNSQWTETFGRTVAEAMLMGVRCLLQPSLRSTFGEHALYCAPSEVSDVLERIRTNLAAERAAAEKARLWCVAQYSAETVPDRLDQLLGDPVTQSRRGAVFASPLKAARKWVGFHRRRSVSR
ncbi:hypothetical protein K1X12_13700 [Hyphomonas sp. WL0036]|uniref:hypothetical protein n=1 Tax=Hyphomonas sediminis TaxID=2866160 RepID=UPI001C7E4C0F|nr:hypothetical protein [Hyphomonas sediminis]MBY9067960.1 hypothetical protein [Hyphomonas sediminis]